MYLCMEKKYILTIWGLLIMGTFDFQCSQRKMCVLRGETYMSLARGFVRSKKKKPAIEIFSRVLELQTSQSVRLKALTALRNFLQKFLPKVNQNGQKSGQNSKNSKF